jgi:hypothetical protein
MDTAGDKSVLTLRSPAMMCVQWIFLYFSFSIRRSSFSAMRARYSNILIIFFSSKVTQVFIFDGVYRAF